MGRLCSVDGEILFRWGRLCSIQSLRGRLHFSQGENLFPGETLFCDTCGRRLIRRLGVYSIARAVSSIWNKLQPVLSQISDPSYELTKTSPLKCYLSIALPLCTLLKLHSLNGYGL